MVCFDGFAKSTFESLNSKSLHDKVKKAMLIKIGADTCSLYFVIYCFEGPKKSQSAPQEFSL